MMLRGGEACLWKSLWKLSWNNPFERGWADICALAGISNYQNFFIFTNKFFAEVVDSLFSKFNVKFSHFSETVKALNQKKQCQSPASLWRQSCAQIALSPWLPWHSKLQVKLYFVNHLHPCRLELLSDRNLFCWFGMDCHWAFLEAGYSFGHKL